MFDQLSSVFFFFKQKTAYEMRISDWSSDVCSSDLLVGAEICLEDRIERDVALVVAEQVELHVSHARPRQIEIVQRMAVRRYRRRIGDTMRVLPDGRLGLEERAQGLAVGRRGVLPVGPDRIPAVTQAFLIGIAVLRNDGRDPLGMFHGQAEDRKSTRLNSSH